MFFQERIFGPLQMKDTGFAVPDAEWRPMATAYAHHEGTGIRPMKDGYGVSSASTRCRVACS
ncbi:hypothetical protein [Sorangium sp. So ce385]|uniref:hypothetical protein n=1 Tax=Sorangium sp. So ce385 TaxID=3133308 RepID=UPI003F5C468A